MLSPFDIFLYSLACGGGLIVSLVLLLSTLAFFWSVLDRYVKKEVENIRG